MRLVDADQKPGISCFIQIFTPNSCRVVGSVAGDLKIDAARVVLSAVDATGVVKSDPFVPDNIHPLGNCGRDGGSPGIVVIVQFVGCPRSANLQILAVGGNG